MINRIKLGALWIWSHRTKCLGGVGTGLSYAYMNQDKLQLFIAAKYYAGVMGVIAALTFAVGCYNTFAAKRQAI